GVLAVRPLDQVRQEVLGRDVVDQLKDRRFLVRLQVVDLIQQLTNAQPVLVGRQHLDQRGLGIIVLAEQVDQAVHVVARARRQRGDRALYRACVRIREPADDDVQRLVGDQRGQNLDVLDHLPTVGAGNGVENLRDGGRAELAELFERLPGGGRARVGGVLDL